jgi:hypothetical protein
MDITVSEELANYIPWVEEVTHNVISKNGENNIKYIM